jgi:hypothetical protein
MEALLTSPNGFGLVKASRLQRAICRVADGVPLGKLWDDEGVRRGFGDVRPPETAPRTLVILAAARGGKSMMAGSKAVVCAHTCDVSGLSPGDQLRVPILSVDKDSATQTFNHILGNIQASPYLRSLLIGKPTADSLTIKHATGRPVEITVVAMSKYGSTLISRWFPSVIFDEATRLAGSADGVRNLDDALHAIPVRMRPGAQILIIGSPNAPHGPVFDMVAEHYGKPSTRLVVVKGTGPLLHPSWFTPERVEEIRLDNPRAYKTDVLGEFSDTDDQLFSSQVIDDRTRKGPLVIPARKGHHHYVAAIDPAMRANAWTLVILGCDGVNDRGEPHYYVALARQWRGNKVNPLRPDFVLREIAQILKPYEVYDLWSDQHHIDSLQVIAEQEGIQIHESWATANDNNTRVENIRVLLEDDRLELPPERTLRGDLLRVRRVVNRKSTSIDLGRQTADGRHSDYVPSLGLTLQFPPPLPMVPMKERSLEEYYGITDPEVEIANDNSAAKRVFNKGRHG